MSITIIVAGNAGCGKSTIAKQIHSYLSLAGLNVKLIDDENISVSDMARNTAALACKPGYTIEIKTQQTIREQSEPVKTINPALEEELFNKLKNIIADQLGVNPDIITKESDYVIDLGADSLDTVELIMSCEEEFGIMINDEDAEKMRTIADTMKYLIDKGVVK